MHLMDLRVNEKVSFIINRLVINEFFPTHVLTL